MYIHVYHSIIEILKGMHVRTCGTGVVHVHVLVNIHDGTCI